MEGYFDLKWKDHKQSYYSVYYFFDWPKEKNYINSKRSYVQWDYYVYYVCIGLVFTCLQLQKKVFATKEYYEIKWKDNL